MCSCVWGFTQGPSPQALWAGRCLASACLVGSAPTVVNNNIMLAGLCTTDCS
jgi:hypothetical protein